MAPLNEALHVSSSTTSHNDAPDVVDEHEGSPLMGKDPPPRAANKRSPPASSSMMAPLKLPEQHEHFTARLNRRRRMAVITASVVLVVLVVALCTLGNPKDYYLNLLDWLEAHPSRSSYVLVGAICVCTVLGLSGNLMWTSAGVVVRPYGLAVLSATSGMVLGSSMAFVIGRAVLRPWVSDEVAARPKLAALDRAVRRRGLRLMLALRLALVFPYTLLNYTFGASGVTYGDYVVATVGGTLPSVLVFGYVGSLARDVHSIASSAGGGVDGGEDEDGGGGGVRYAAMAVGTGVILVSCLYGIFTWAKRVVREEVELSSPPPSSSTLSLSSDEENGHEYEPVPCQRTDGESGMGGAVIQLVDSPRDPASSRWCCPGSSTREENVPSEASHGHAA